jgi:hypothetical protein
MELFADNISSATAAAVVKLSFIPNYGKTGDLLWDSTDITIWTVWVSIDLLSIINIKHALIES